MRTDGCLFFKEISIQALKVREKEDVLEMRWLAIVDKNCIKLLSYVAILVHVLWAFRIKKRFDVKNEIALRFLII